MTTMTSRPQRLYLLQVAAAPPPISAPFVCYLIQTGDGRNILIDSGLPANIHTLQLPPGFPGAIMGSDVIEQLALLGLRPDDIELPPLDKLVTTCYSYDHRVIE